MALRQPGFMSQFAQGYGFVDDRIRRNRLDEERSELRERQEERADLRLDMQEQSLAHRLEEARLQRKYRRRRAAESDRRWQAEFDYRRGRDQAADKRAERRLGMEEERLGMERSRDERRRSEADRERQAERVNQILGSAAEAYARGEPLSPGMLQEFEELTGDSLYDVASPEYGAAIETVEQVFEDPQRADDPEVLSAINYLYEPQINRMVGSEHPQGGTITDVRIADLYPGRQDGTFAAELEVVVEQDGDTRTYRAPMTERRSTDEDDDVRQVSMDNAVQSLLGRKALHRWVNQDPRMRDWLAQQAQAHGGERPLVVGDEATGAGGADGDAPAQIQVVEWVAQYLTDGDRRAAWQLAQQSKSNPQELAAKLFLERKKDLRNQVEMGMVEEMPSDEELMQDVMSAMQQLDQLDPMTRSRTPASPSTPAAEPATPDQLTAGETVIDGYRYTGGDPNDSQNWERVQ